MDIGQQRGILISTYKVYLRYAEHINNQQSAQRTIQVSRFDGLLNIYQGVTSYSKGGAQVVKALCISPYYSFSSNLFIDYFEHICIATILPKGGRHMGYRQAGSSARNRCVQKRALQILRP